ncbi:hypothetical protein [Litchfieldia salsa]|uniref:Uncharacterized protein n=1 Tax=Litchfieldia salsa TaxID=930152 RepID=A0A1H0UU80_9BACI|nr:hypothetical protein [Litchfieldia salsa]SDP69645.1 hypothetical protein SAMN05216565_105164 [Litchfieldia salsa]
MSIKRKVSSILVILLSLPILLSLDSPAYDSTYYAKFKSPENIMFLSYTENWNEQKLEQLYHELIKNKHGEEIFLLQEVRVIGEPKFSDLRTRGQYHSLTNTITLYHADTSLEASELAGTLSHEYGHHFTYHYLKEHHLPNSTWAKLRGLQGEPVRWDAFWNYSTSHHMWYPQEIIADDYVLLYGATKPVKIEDVFTNEAFYRKTIHDNQEVANVLDNTELHRYLEEQTGIAVDEDRLLSLPEFIKYKENVISYKISQKANVAYRLNVTSFNKNNKQYHEFLIITDEHTQDVINFPIPEMILSMSKAEINLEIVDLNTSIGFQTNLEYIVLTD